IKDNEGNVTAIHCSYIPESKSGNDISGIRAKGTIHWVSAAHAAEAEVRLYDRLFTIENPAAGEGDFTSYINRNSLQVIKTAYIESSLKDAVEGEKFQFIRKGYFTPDKHSSPRHLIFNRTVTLKDTWARESRKEQA